MATRARDNKPDSPERQATVWPRVVPQRDEVLLMLDEVAGTWELSEYAVYKAVREGRLRRVRRPGYQPYYVYSDVVACFGEPRFSPPLNSVKDRESVKGP